MPTAPVMERCLRQLRERLAPWLGLPPWRGTIGSTLLQDARHANRLVLWLLLSQWILGMVWFLVQHVRSKGLRGPSLGVWIVELAVAAGAALPIVAWLRICSGKPANAPSTQERPQEEVEERAVWADQPQDPLEVRRTPQARERERVLSKKLGRAIAEGSLRVVYQPLFTGDRSVTAAEALARWHDEEEGEISPAVFIPVAEATGLISALSTLVMRQACEQMRRWIVAGYSMQRVAVNVSVMQVCREDFVATVIRILQETRLEPHHLELEVTESALARDFAPIKEHLGTLRRLGVRISIDDFGTGYSSLGRLRELDADVLKIDKVFVQSAVDTLNGRAVVQAIIEMAHTLNLSVVAEGVETQRQMDLLRSLRCDEMQGFLLSRPHSPDMLIPLFRAEPGREQTALHKPHLVARTA